MTLHSKSQTLLQHVTPTPITHTKLEARLLLSVFLVRYSDNDALMLLPRTKNTTEVFWKVKSKLCRENVTFYYLFLLYT